jgi:hypothetical protein
MRASIILLVVFLAGCPYDPYTSVYTTKQPNSNDVIGVYVADTNTLALIAKEGHYSAVSPSITLSSGGEIIITNIPDWWLASFGKPQGGFDSGCGHWSIQKHQKWWGLSVDFPDTPQFSSLKNKPGGMSTEMMLIGEKPPYKIYLNVGDPDDGRGMQFERLAPEKKGGCKKGDITDIR